MLRSYTMMDRLEQSNQAGRFTLPRGKEILGELTLAGAKTSLYLHDRDFFAIQRIPDQYIRGVLHDLTKVSLFRCVTLSGTGTASQGSERYHFATLFPHFVVSGGSHLAPNERAILEALFVIDDASTLFYDFDAFGSVLDARPYIEQIANANEHIIHRKVKTGSDPQILYFAGLQQICATETVLGKISAWHCPSGNLGGPEGIWLKNTITVSIAFKEPVDFDDSVCRVGTLVPFFGLLVGRPQNILRLRLRVQAEKETPEFLEVYWSMPPARNARYEGEKPHPADVLLDPAMKPEEFSRVLVDWLSRHDSWRDARSRFFTSFDEQIYHDIDRLIRSANMFDILPEAAAPPDAVISSDIQAAKDAAQKLFRSLPDTPERHSVLGALGRIGKSNLKHKIRDRAEIVMTQMPGRFSEITIVTDEAVNCRNHYVHGSDARIDYSANQGMTTFFTDALEFVFAASDLIDGGWDVKAWAGRGTTMSHPFGRFLVSYEFNLQQLKTLLPARSTPVD
ncbi:MAG TPA: HEPN domain-containing protein [Candidatus Acidoferrales bacterium]|nr:HEPN domain-containing protein [Candidatus Acidoferrales bacterium]